MLDVTHLPFWGDCYMVNQEVPVLTLKIMQ